MRVLTGKDVDCVLSKLTIEETLAICGSALTAYSSGTAECPPRIVIESSNYTSLHMPSIMSNLITEKVVSLSKTPGQGLPASIIILDEQTGKVKSIMNADQITAVRTGGCAVLSSVYRRDMMASKDNAWTVKTLLVFGGGEQAYYHIRLFLMACTTLERVTIRIRRPSARTTAFVDSLRKQFKQEIVLHITEADLESHLIEADIISCCTPSTESLFPSELLKRRKGIQHVTCIGSYKPHMREVDDELFSMADHVFVDSKSDCLREAGELMSAISKNVIQAESITELGPLLSLGDKLFSDGLTLYKSVGISVMDNALARAVLKLAEEQNLGVMIDDY